MENLCAEYQVYFNGRCIGCCIIEKQGIRYKIYARVTVADLDKPFRLSAICGDSMVNLGVMVPKCDAYQFSRIYTNAAFRELGLENVSGFTITSDLFEVLDEVSGQTENVLSKWNHIAEPGTLLEEGEFRRIFSQCSNTIVCCEENITYLAVPVIHGEEFPAMPVFCLGEARKINGGIYLVFKIRNGKLIF